MVRFGCPNSEAEVPARIGEDGHRLPFYDSYHIVSPARLVDTTSVMACQSQCHQKRLEIRLWMNRNQRDLKLCQHQPEDFGIDHVPELADGDRGPGLTECVALHSVEQEKLNESRPTTFVAVFSLVDAHSAIETLSRPPIRSIDAMRYLGIADRDRTSFSPYRLW
jgi:hypothetical protein